MKKTVGTLILALLVNVICLPFILLPAQAAGASLFFSPSKSDLTPGKTFSVKVMVNSGGGKGINAAQFKFAFDPALLKINSVDTGDSIFSLWVVGKKGYNFSNTSGTFEFGGGSPGTDAYTGTAGTACSVSFTALKAGAAEVKITEGMVLANDGVGTNILSGMGSAAFTVKEEEKKETPTTPAVEKKVETKPTETKTEEKGILPPPPEVESPTHPKEDVWYSSKTAEFKWKMLADVVGVAISMTDKPDSDPGTDSEGIVDNKIFEKVENGQWYLHIKFKNKFGWSQVTHRKFLVDHEAPETFSIKADDGGDPTNPTPKLLFETADKVSGMDKYTLLIDNEQSEIPARDFKAEPYITKGLMPGEHKIEVTAYDKAGNAASSSFKLLTEPLKMPIIKDIPKTLISGRENLVILGTSFYPDVTVQINIARVNKDPEIFEVTTDAEGNWSFYSDKKFDKETYEIWAKIIDSRGAQSYPTAKNIMVVKAPSIIQAYGLLIIVVLLLIIAGETLMIMYLRKKFEEEKTRIKRETGETKEVVSKVFNALKEELDEQLEFADKKRGLSESERRVKERLQEALEIAQEFIVKEVDDTEKEIDLKEKDK